MLKINDQHTDRAYKSAVRKSMQQNQRALKIGIEIGTFTGEEWLSVCERYDYRCVLCGCLRPLTPDHVVPLMSGGSNFIQNIQPLCHPCNIIKRGTTMDYRTSDTLQPDYLTGTSPGGNRMGQVPRPIWRAELIIMEQRLGERHQSRANSTRYQTYPDLRKCYDFVPALLAEIRRMRNLILSNETLSHVESFAWWSRGTLPTALDTYLTMATLCQRWVQI
jgi:5-methylcytosine-specific restriction endonuclease McrA